MNEFAAFQLVNCEGRAMEISLVELSLVGLAILIIFVAIVCALKCNQKRSVERLALNTEKEIAVIKKTVSFD